MAAAAIEEDEEGVEEEAMAVPADGEDDKVIMLEEVGEETLRYPEGSVARWEGFMLGAEKSDTVNDFSFDDDDVDDVDDEDAVEEATPARKRARSPPPTFPPLPP